MSVTIDLPEGLLAGVFHVPEPEVPRHRMHNLPPEYLILKLLKN